MNDFYFPKQQIFDFLEIWKSCAMGRKLQYTGVKWLLDILSSENYSMLFDSSKLIFQLEMKQDIIYIINDPLGQTHSPTSSNNYFQPMFVLLYDILKSTDGQQVWK